MAKHPNPYARWHMRGMRPRSEFAPADLIRGVERDRARFRQEVMINPSTWEIAKKLRDTLKGETGEGLRGIYDPADGDHGQIYWWPRDAAAHHQGRLLLGIDANRSSDVVLEVEANVDNNGTIYLAWGHIPPEGTDHSPAFLAHPSIGPLMDGCLTRSGRVIQLTRDARIKLHAEMPADVDRYTPQHPERTGLWQQMQDDADSWAKSRSRRLPDGQPMPSRKALALYRLWIASQNGWFSNDPLPKLTVGNDGAILLTWRGPDRFAQMTFGDQIHSLRTVIHGRVHKQIAEPIRTKHQMHRYAIHPNLHGFRSVNDGPR